MTVLRDFDSLAAPLTEAFVGMREEVTVIPRRSEYHTYVGREEETWTWTELRDFVVAQIEQRHGPWPRDSKKEYGIFSSFLTRWGAQAVPIARYAFEQLAGRWAGAPISVNRFCRGSDPFFAAVIVERLESAAQASTADWR